MGGGTHAFTEVADLSVMWLVMEVVASMESLPHGSPITVLVAVAAEIIGQDEAL